MSHSKNNFRCEKDASEREAKEGKEMREMPSSAKRAKRAKSAKTKSRRTVPALPLELWETIVRGLLSRKGMGWIKEVHALLQTCKMFNRMLCQFALEYLSRWNKRFTSEYLIPLGICNHCNMPSVSETQEALQSKLSGKVKKRDICDARSRDLYRAFFEFDYGKEQLFAVTDVELVVWLEHSREDFRVVLFFTPELFQALTLHARKKAEHRRYKLERLKNAIPQMEGGREKQKLVLKTLRIEHELAMLELL